MCYHGNIVNCHWEQACLNLFEIMIILTCLDMDEEFLKRVKVIFFNGSNIITVSNCLCVTNETGFLFTQSFPLFVFSFESVCVCAYVWFWA